MIRSMFSAISGLRNHQTMMDVVGNNISNVNTTGFKSQSTIFEDVLSQTVRAAAPLASIPVFARTPEALALLGELAGVAE